MNFRDVGVKKMDEAFSRDKMWRIRKIFCPILWNKKKKPTTNRNELFSPIQCAEFIISI